MIRLHGGSPDALRSPALRLAEAAGRVGGPVTRLDDDDAGDAPTVDVQCRVDRQPVGAAGDAGRVKPAGVAVAGQHGGAASGGAADGVGQDRLQRPDRGEVRTGRLEDDDDVVVPGHRHLVGRTGGAPADEHLVQRPGRLHQRGASRRRGDLEPRPSTLGRVAVAGGQLVADAGEGRRGLRRVVERVQELGQLGPVGRQVAPRQLHPCSRQHPGGRWRSRCRQDR